MNTTHIDTSQLLDALANGCLLLTANRRRALTLEQRYSEAQQLSGRRVWQRPRILPWGDWLSACHAELVVDQPNTPQRLDPFQAQLLWEEIISDWGERHQPLLQTQGAARNAAAAWRLLIEWRLPDEQLRQHPDRETAIFLSWADDFRQRCAQLEVIDPSRLPDQLHEAFAQGLLAVPPQLLLAGFEQFSPQQQALLEWLSDNGCDLQIHRPDGNVASIERREFPSPQLELRGAIEWAKAQWLADPKRRIGIALPQLTEQRAQLEAMLRDSLHPELRQQAGEPASPLYNLSQGLPLSDYPLVAHALQWLQLVAGPQPLDRVGALLRSPFIVQGQTRLDTRAALDAALRKTRIPELTLAGLLHQLQSLPADEPLLDALGRLAEHGMQLPARAPVSEWSALLRGLLRDIGWPGEQTLDSREYQTLQRLEQAFADFSRLSTVQPPLGLRGAVALLRRLLSEQTFQPQTGNAPIQILGLLEALGQPLDALWVAGLTDDNWPPAASPNPLLPIALQREHDVPHASVERELAWAEQITTELLGQCPCIIVSHAARDGDSNLAPSPLIAHYPPGNATAPVTPSTSQPLTPDRLTDEQAHALPAHFPARGGSQLLADQSDCPFRAFARHRLGAEPLEQRPVGLDPRDWGGLVHHALETLWQSLGDQATLKALDNAARGALVEQHVQQALQRWLQRAPHRPGTRLQQLIRQRLLSLLDRWLVFESQRSQPFTVEQREQQRELEIGGIVLTLRIDRIDQLSDGSRLVIDYKTGKGTQRPAWLAERIEEPQLPLYCQLPSPPVDGAVLGVVHEQKLCFVGAARDADALGLSRKNRLDWEQLQTHWQQKLPQLAEDFRHGEAAVDPARDNSCDYCHLGPLCRIGIDHD